MSTLNLTAGFTVQIGAGPVIGDGSTSIPIPVTVTGLSGSFQGTAASATTVTLWDTAKAYTTTFTVGFIFSDQSGTIEIQGGSSANNSNIQILAGVPLILPGTTLTYNSSGGFLGSSTPVTSVKLKQSSGSVANVRGWFFN